MTAPAEYLAQLIAAQARLTEADKWSSGRFKDIKGMSMTTKGNIAEDFVVWLGKHHGFEAEAYGQRRGPYDVKIAGKTLEIKMASEDVNQKFQFNGIRLDTKYDLLLVIGISPDQVLFNIYPRRDVGDMPIVSMAKGTNSSFKLTRNIDQLLDLARFPDFFSK